ncbi:Transcriptional regulator, GntR family [Nostocoides australiense Ben110]|uniref:Transcriptional regulator, GntR family n=1 Tax=Nostocoides australiense Ben110 TaxID=1193182 RepID=W6JVB7_9MICO|nr:GntR family transcriptional regulator [Tetrasphaera australiensis]CCH72907.1 Transcriptional regulator, GntR family [Tetrasphaera australiensis Ben110]
MRRPSGSHAVYQELRRRILQEELAPGERLHESALAADLGVSRTPYREAVRLLMAEGLLDQLPTGGVVVRGVSARDIEELYAVRAALEGLMAACAATRVDAAAVTRLESLVERNARLVDLPQEAAEAGHGLHLAIAEIAGNDWATKLHSQVDAQMSRYRHYTNETQKRREAALDEHRRIVEALRAGDAATARSAAESHVLAARDTALASIAGRLRAQRF